MSKRSILVFALILVLGLLLVGCSKAEKAPETSKSGQTNTGQAAQKQGPVELEEKYLRADNGKGGVEVSIFWGAPEYFRATGNEQAIIQYDLENRLIFEVSMNTHSGDLREYPMMEKAELTVDGKVLKPIKWQLSSRNSHHPAGLLVFPAKDDKGEPLVKVNSKMQLNIKDLRDVPERIFVWQLPIE